MCTEPLVLAATLDRELYAAETSVGEHQEDPGWTSYPWWPEGVRSGRCSALVLLASRDGFGYDDVHWMMLVTSVLSHDITWHYGVRSGAGLLCSHHVTMCHSELVS